MLPTLARLQRALSPWNLRGEIDRLFEDFFGEEKGAGGAEGNGGRFLPPLDVRETEDALIVEAELPGLKEKDIEVKVEDGVLFIGAERKQEKDEKTKDYHRIERYYGRMERRLALPDFVDAEKAQAAYKDGVLQVTLPRRPGTKPRSVPVQVKAGK
ncbi:MAG: Hsp20/alpha crystallin family protein [Planctomycetota bacterium]